MNINFVCYLIFPLIVACQKNSAVNASNLPEPDTAITNNSYSLVTAASTISVDTGNVYRLGLAPYASFFKLDRSVKNGDVYYEAILESSKQFSPLKFYISKTGNGQVTAVAAPSEAELEKFNKEWQR